MRMSSTEGVVKYRWFVEREGPRHRPIQNTVYRPRVVRFLSHGEPGVNETCCDGSFEVVAGVQSELEAD